MLNIVIKVIENVIWLQSRSLFEVAVELFLGDEDCKITTTTTDNVFLKN